MTDDRMYVDLQGSLLEPEDINAREMGNPERAATNLGAGVTGYVIPYRTLEGKALPFYRVRCFDLEPKYRQVKNTSNTVYFPKGVKELILSKGYVILTEGEKKAASATKHGFPTVGFGGVDSWRNRSLVLPEDTEMKHVHGRDSIAVKLPAGNEDLQEIESSLAVGLQDLIDLCCVHGTKVIVAYDTDFGIIKFDVQRAASALGFELRFRGIPFLNIKQLILPTIEGIEKVGLDDFLVHSGRDTLEKLVGTVMSTRNCFPKHPNVRDFVNKKLQKTKMSRKEAQATSLAVLCELDGMGQRLRNSSTDQLYYFHTPTKRLLQASLRKLHNDSLADSPFSRFLYKEFGIGTTDMRILSWLSNQFTTEDPIDHVSPSRVCTVTGDEFHLQINDGQFITIRGQDRPDKDGNDRFWEVRDNGSGGVLFESGRVAGVPGGDVETALRDTQAKPAFKPYWPEVLKSVRLKRKDNAANLFSLLFYLSPFINRWRGTQLPVEMIIGEAGSGKSSLYELRLNILVGEPALRNAPSDLKDWHASIANSGGLHVTDNVQLVDKNLRQRLSDEICRIITEPNPHIEMRKYYTESDLVRIPIQSTFAITAIAQPFRNTDLVQRSIIIELDKGDEAVEYDSNWSRDQLARFGGRAAWIAHQCHALHLFLKLVRDKWNPRYMAKHRLVNLEQALMMMAEAVGIEKEWIPEYLAKVTNQAMADADWALQGLATFATQMKSVNKVKGKEPPKFSATDICDWAQTDEDFAGCQQLTNPRSLGRYLSLNKQLISLAAGIKEAGTINNKAMFQVR